MGQRRPWVSVQRSWGGALLLKASLTLTIPLSINFAHSLNPDSAPLKETHEFSFKPKPDDGPVTVTRELIIRPEDREEFLALIKQLRLIFLRNGAFLFRVDENLEHSGTFRTEMLVSSWAEHLRQFARMTKAETELVERVWAMHAGEQEPVVRHYLPANRLWTPLGFSRFQKQPDARFTQATPINADSEQDLKKSEAAKAEPWSG